MEARSRGRPGRLEPWLSLPARGPWPPLASGCAVRGMGPLPGCRVPGAGPAGGAGAVSTQTQVGTCWLGDGVAQSWGAVSLVWSSPCLPGEVHVPGPRVLCCCSAPRAGRATPPAVTSPRRAWGSPGQGMSMGMPPTPPSLPAGLCPPGPGSRPSSVRPRVDVSARVCPQASRGGFQPGLIPVSVSVPRGGAAGDQTGPRGVSAECPQRVGVLLRLGVGLRPGRHTCSRPTWALAVASGPLRPPRCPAPRAPRQASGQRKERVDA